MGYPINLIIFTKIKWTTIDGDASIPYVRIIKKIKELIKNEIGVEPNVTFVFINKDEHDRTILTNYKMFISGDSFKYFNIDGDNITKGQWMHIENLYDDINHKQAKMFLLDLQNIIDSVKNRCNAIVGDKKSLFLNFN